MGLVELKNKKCYDSRGKINGGSGFRKGLIKNKNKIKIFEYEGL